MSRSGARRIAANRSIVIACDLTTIGELERLVSATCRIDGVGGYKVGFSLGLKYGLPEVVSAIKRHTPKPVMYDHQKGGTDVPHTGALFAEVMAEAGMDYAILFPFASPSTEKAWIEALQREGVIPVIGAIMTIPDFLKDGGGYIDSAAVSRIFELAASLGVNDYVLPGNKPDAAAAYRRLIEGSVEKPTYFLPGVGAQGGEITSLRGVMGERWHGIVGRTIYGAKDQGAAASSLASELR